MNVFKCFISKIELVDLVETFVEYVSHIYDISTFMEVVVDGNRVPDAIIDEIVLH
jgi:methyl coenzyme M reductase subunit D